MAYDKNQNNKIKQIHERLQRPTMEECPSIVEADVSLVKRHTQKSLNTRYLTTYPIALSGLFSIYISTFSIFWVHVCFIYSACYAMPSFRYCCLLKFDYFRRLLNNSLFSIWIWIELKASANVL